MKKNFILSVIVAFLTGLLAGCSGGAKHEIPEAPPSYVQLEKNGQSYEVYAAQGQVWLLFESSVSPQQAEQILAQNNAKILDKRPEMGYYIVEVAAGTESEFVSSMQYYQEINYVYPNAIRTIKAATPYVLDNFNGKHGRMVSDMLKESASKASIEKSVALGKSQSKMSDDAINNELSSSLSSTQSGSSAVIVMSWGYDLPSDGLWSQASSTDQDWFQNMYVDEIVGMVKYTLQQCQILDREVDFVVTKAAGNEGVKELERFLGAIDNALSPEERNFYKQHFLIVTAKDDNKDLWNDYPNTISNGGYNEMLSAVDISDKTANNKKEWEGTSFSTPRLAGYIVKAADKYGVKVTEVLQYVRRVTKKASNHVIDYEMLEAAISSDLEIIREGYVDLGLPSGTLWKNANETGYHICNEAQERYGERLPTINQFKELDYYCTWEAGEQGYKVTGPNGNSIFLPVEGYMWGNSMDQRLDVGEKGHYCSSTTHKYVHNTLTDYPIQPGTEIISEMVYFPSPIYNENCADINASKQEKYSVRLVKAPDYIDLGLPSGTLWKEQNEPRLEFSLDDAKEMFGNQMPTKEQWEELKDRCEWEWNWYGYKVIGPNSNSIFIPCENIRKYSPNNRAEYWTSTPFNQWFNWEFCMNDYGRLYTYEEKYGFARHAVRLVK